jgi:hypothetical protein
VKEIGWLIMMATVRAIDNPVGTAKCLGPKHQQTKKILYYILVLLFRPAAPIEKHILYQYHLGS